MKCSYCSADIERGTGLMYVYKTGNTTYYCSNRCFKNDVVMHKSINRKLVEKNIKGASPAAKPTAAEAKKPTPAA